MCKHIYDAFKVQISFHEPLPPFEAQIPHQLESILESVRGSYAGQQFFPTILDVSAAYYYKIACSQVFANGNKRLSILFTDYYLWSHKINLDIPQEKFYLITEELASLSEKGISHDVIQKVARKIIQENCLDLEELSQRRV